MRINYYSELYKKFFDFPLSAEILMSLQDAALRTDNIISNVTIYRRK
jgi:hypothetical protein